MSFSEHDFYLDFLCVVGTCSTAIFGGGEGGWIIGTFLRAQGAVLKTGLFISCVH
jgi:hypothetical protein